MLSPYEEKELLCRTAKGDEAAFGQIFHAYHQRLGAFIYRLTESFPATQEIVQDVFVRIWLKRETLPEVTSFEAYLFTAARNHAYNYIRKAARERALEASLSLPAEAEPDERFALLEKAISQLPRQQQNVYLLHRHQGLSHAEIAEQLHLSVETVKKHMSLALRSIRTFLTVGRLTG
ncbi:RNA polymerase sigma-70 factor [Dinghuibacter silviterrae]|uniref:RNA polymerase sigma-70 factor n=1 Tax=Dinghuibacter silviterrae TaxID=1539049 RepID=UPI0013C30784|nr:RNA polymerase sigma-70 factor [Dinghuibacter silviterrae]